MDESLTTSEILVVTSGLLTIPLLIVMVYFVRRAIEAKANRNIIFVGSFIIVIMSFMISIFLGFGMLLDSFQNKFQSSIYFLLLCSTCFPLLTISAFISSIWQGKKRQQWRAMLEDKNK